MTSTTPFPNARRCTPARCHCEFCGTHGRGWPLSREALAAMQNDWPVHRSGAQRRAAKAQGVASGAIRDGNAGTPPTTIDHQEKAP